MEALEKLKLQTTPISLDKKFVITSAHQIPQCTKRIMQSGRVEYSKYVRCHYSKVNQYNFLHQ